MTWTIGQLVRVKTPLSPDVGRTVKRVTKTLVVLSDDSRWRLKTGRPVGAPHSTRRIEAWGEQFRREAA